MAVHGFGINDADYPVRNLASYVRWSHIIRRCYSKSQLIKNPSYNKVSVCEEWRRFTNFKKWFDKNHVEGWDIDKDILTDSNIYSPDTAIFVPKWVNLFIVTPDSSRGEFPVGVSIDKRSGKYKAQCREITTSKKISIGLYDSPESARLAWLNKKIEMLSTRKDELDSIDTRLYHRMIEILNRK